MLTNDLKRWIHSKSILVCRFSFKLSKIALLCYLLMPYAHCSANPLVQPQGIPCKYSDGVFEEDAALMSLAMAPTRFRLMTSRYVSMVQAERAFQCTKTATIGFDGHDYQQTGKSDDPGLMELIPTISRLSGLPVADSYDVLIFVLIFLGIALGYVGFWRLTLDCRVRWVGVAVFLCIAIAEARVADEYVFQIAPFIAAIPWLVYLGLKQSRIVLPLTAAGLAFCCAFCSIVRSGSASICLTFLVAMFVTRYRYQKPLVPIILALLSCIPAVLFAHSLIARRTVALAKVGETARTVNSHPIWHTLYIGIGFVPNSEVSGYRDEVARDKVLSIDPTVAYTSAKYQSILKHELWDMVKRRPFLVLGIFGLKTAIVIALALIFLFPVRRLIFADSSFLWLDIPFLLAIAMSGMNGIIAIPRLAYLLTFLCLASLYTFLKLCAVGRCSDTGRLSMLKDD